MAGPDCSCDAPIDAGHDAPVDAPSGGDGGQMFTLTINNYLSWCSVSVNGGTASTASSIMQMFPAGTVVNLHGDTANTSLFIWGYWTGTDGDTTSAHDRNKMTTVTLSSDKNVLACCPTIGTTTCP